MRTQTTSVYQKLKAKQAAWTEAAPERARLREERHVENARIRAEVYEQELEHMAELPHFLVRQTREVLVAAEDMNDAIALANAAFKEGQDEDGTIKWRKPFGVEGDTIEKIRTLNVKAIEVEEYGY